MEKQDQEKLTERIERYETKSEEIIKDAMDGWRKSIKLNEKMIREQKSSLLINLILYAVWFFMGVLWGIRLG